MNQFRVVRMRLIGWLILFLMIEVVGAFRLFAFNITMTWDVPAGATTNDVITTNMTRFADISAVNVYRGTTSSNFVLYAVLPPTTNVATFQNLPNQVSFMFIKFTNTFGEGGASSTNQIFPPGKAPDGNTFNKK